MYLLAICVSFEKYLLRSTTSFLSGTIIKIIWLLCFSSSYIRDANLLSDTLHRKQVSHLTHVESKKYVILWKVKI